MGKKVHNCELNLVKFFFAVIVFLYHSCKAFEGNVATIFPYGWSATEFFFIVSGYLMVQSSRRYDGQAIGKSTLDFLCRKVKAIFPFYIIAFLVSFGVRQLAFGLERDIRHTVFSDFTRAINEMLFLQNSGISFGPIYNGPTWYLSAMILAMTFLFPLLLKAHDWYVNIGGFCIAFMSYAFLSNNLETLNASTQWMYMISAGLLRAVAAISLGVFLFGLISRLRENNIMLTKYGRALLFVVELVLFAVLLLIMQKKNVLRGKNQFDYVMVILIFAICFIVLSELTQINRFLPSKICSFIGNLSLPLYLFHRPVIYVFLALNMELSYGYFMLFYAIATGSIIALAYAVRAVGHTLCEKYGKKYLIDASNR